LNERELYCSPNGDCWYLCRAETGHALIRHVPNEPSGGLSSFIEIGPFLASGNHGPQHQELLRLFGTLVDEHSFASERSSVEGGPARKPQNEQDSYEVGDLARRHGISNDQASRLIRQVGADRDKLDAEAEKLTKG
jgi:hypothetical protein